MRRRRAIAIFMTGIVVCLSFGVALAELLQTAPPATPSQAAEITVQQKASQSALETLEVKGRAPKTGYERKQFGNGWAKVNGCTTREIILYRDLKDKTMDGECKVIAGTLNDPYTGTVIMFSKDKSSAVQIDHVVALSNAWQTGAQQLSFEKRQQLANDPLELLAVDGPANQAKGDGDAATWLPKNKAFRCEYVSRQIAVKVKYSLWVTVAEKEVMKRVLDTC